ncbi:MAG: hypothetical protein ACFB03_17725 [Paracoccaceae bacterium]
MTNDAPPSAHERAQLKAARKRDLPRPAPSLQPRAMGHAVRSTAKEASRERAQIRETRIQSIDRALAKEKGHATARFGQVKGQPHQAHAKSNRINRGKSAARRDFTRSR